MHTCLSAFAVFSFALTGFHSLPAMACMLMLVAVEQIHHLLDFITISEMFPTRVV
jgi:hypothetical protein